MVVQFVFLWAYAVFQLLGLIGTLAKTYSEDAATRSSAWIGSVAGSLLLGGLIWTILNVTAVAH